MSGRILSFPNILELPIFPLPNVVLFPHTVLPLYVFEPRYKQMVSEALEEGNPIGMALLLPGWENDYYGSPAIFETGGMGVITEHEELGEGEYNILLSGRRRYRVVDEVRENPYRVARVQLLDDPLPNRQVMTEAGEELARRFRDLTHENPPSQPGLEVLETLDFATLVNSICSSLNLSVYDRQHLLELDGLRARAEKILEILTEQVDRTRLLANFRHLKPEDSSVN